MEVDEAKELIDSAWKIRAQELERLLWAIYHMELGVLSGKYQNTSLLAAAIMEIISKQCDAPERRKTIHAELDGHVRKHVPTLDIEEFGETLLKLHSEVAPA